MKRYLFIALLPLLTACGGDDSKTTTSAQDTNAPNVQVPNDRTVILTDYDCLGVHEYTDANGAFQHREYKSKGLNRYWKDSGFSLSYDEESDGSARSLAKYQSVGLEDGKVKMTSEWTDWQLVNGSWTKSVEHIERLSQKTGNVKHLISNVVDGVDKPYYEEIETTEVDAKTTRTVSRYVTPSKKDHDGLHYSKYEDTCTNVER